MRIFNKKRGFTLIELLVVIAIIGILAGIVLVSMGSARKKARDARREADIRQISLAMEMAYDNSAEECGGPESYITASSTPGKICTTNGQYLNPTPKDPNGSDYGWVDNTTDCGTISAGQWYCAYAILESETGAFVASQRGTKKTPTTTLDCNCGW